LLKGISSKSISSINALALPYNGPAMTLPIQNVPKEYSKSINAVVNFIQANLSDNLSLQKLAALANYSPFHFQKIFRQVTGESPKQFIVRLRLETAAHALIIQLDKPIKEIAMDNGFTSAATFARAFKNYFGFSAENLRAMPKDQRMALYKKGTQNQQLLDTDRYFKKADNIKRETPINIIVKKIQPIHGIVLDSPLDDISIENAFRRIFQLADVNDLLETDSRFIGIIYPHQLSYKAMISIKRPLSSTAKFLTNVIPAAKFGTYHVLGDLQETFRTLRIFTETWLPESGYRLADIWGFELLSQSPLHRPYRVIEREMYIPISPK
jgi:AraC family transcriptional regulator